MKTNLMHYLFSVYFVNKPLHVSGIFVYIYIYIGCPTRYRTWHFFNNFATNGDIATTHRHKLQTHSFSFLTQRTYSCSNFVAVSSLVLELLKKCRVR